MLRTEALEELRHLLDDKVQLYGWSDERLMRFLSLGQKQFCRDTGFFRDSANYSIVTAPDVRAYALPPEIIEVLSVDLEGAELRSDLTGLFDSPGRPFGWRTEMDTKFLTLASPPDGIYTLNLKVWRSARVPFDHKGPSGAYDGEFEIPEDFHFAPIEWAAAKAFGDHDRERQDPVKAADHMRNYKDLAREGKRAFRRLHGTETQVVPDLNYLV